MGNRAIQKKYRQLRKDLRGWYHEVVDRTGLSKSTVSSVLHGKFDNDEVIRVALEVRELALKDRARRINERLNKVVA